MTRLAGFLALPSVLDHLLPRELTLWGDRTLSPAPERRLLVVVIFLAIFHRAGVHTAHPDTLDTIATTAKDWCRDLAEQLATPETHFIFHLVTFPVFC